MLNVKFKVKILISSEQYRILGCEVYQAFGRKFRHHLQYSSYGRPGKPKTVQCFLFFIWVTTVIAMARTKFYFSPHLDWLWSQPLILSSENVVDCFLGSKWTEVLSSSTGPLRMLLLGCDAG